MTEDEARQLLPMYVDGLLKPDQAREVEAAISTAPKLQAEFKTLKAEANEVNALLNEALAPLRPSRSARMRVTDAMVDVHRRAEHVANTMPEKGWRIFRYCFALAAVIAAFVIRHNYPRTSLHDEGLVYFYITIGMYLIGLTFLMFGHVLAEVEGKLIAQISKREIEPTPLEVLTLQVFGILSILASGILYFYLV